MGRLIEFFQIQICEASLLGICCNADGLEEGRERLKLLYRLSLGTWSGACVLRLSWPTQVAHLLEVGEKIDPGLDCCSFLPEQESSQQTPYIATVLCGLPREDAQAHSTIT